MNRVRRTRLLYAIHKWTGLVIGLHVLLFSVTAVYLLAVDLVVSEGHGATGDFVPLDAYRALPVQPMLDRLAAHFPSGDMVAERVTYALADGDLHELRVELEDSHTHLRFGADPYTGALQLTRGTLPEGVDPLGGTAEAAPDAPPAEDVQPLYLRLAALMLSLHTNLALGVLGTLLTGIGGTIFLLSTLTGWIIYAPFMKGMVFGAIRWKRAQPIRWADMHKLVGMAALSFNLIMAVTGIGLTLGLFAIQYQVMQDLKAIEAQVGEIVPVSPPPNIDDVYALAQSVFPDHTVIRLEYPGPDAIQGDKVFTFFAEPDPVEHGLVPKIGIVTAEATPRSQVYELTWWMEAILLGAPLHVGSFGGKPVLFAYLLLGIASGFLSISGYLMYYIKWRRARQRKGRAVDTSTSDSVAENLAARELLHD